MGMTTQHTYIQRYPPPTVTNNNQHSVHEHSINTWHGLTYAYIHYLTPIVQPHTHNNVHIQHQHMHDCIYQVCRLANSVNHRLWTSPRSIRVKRPSSLQGTQHHTRTVLGQLVSHRHHTDMYTGRRGSLTTSHKTLQTPPYHYRVGLHALHSVPT